MLLGERKVLQGKILRSVPSILQQAKALYLWTRVGAQQTQQSYFSLCEDGHCIKLERHHVLYVLILLLLLLPNCPSQSNTEASREILTLKSDHHTLLLKTFQDGPISLMFKFKVQVFTNQGLPDPALTTFDLLHPQPTHSYITH